MDSNSDLMLEVQANSPYNDGWTQQFYREQLEKKQSKTMSKQVDFESTKSLLMPSLLMHLQISLLFLTVWLN